jgi:hypothetical protein
MLLAPLQNTKSSTNIEHGLMIQSLLVGPTIVRSSMADVIWKHTSISIDSAILLAF